MSDRSRWTVHGTSRVYTSDWVNVDLDDVEVPGGPRFDHHVLRFPKVSTGAVVHQDGRVLLIWRHRFTTGTWGWEIPAGWAEPGEQPRDAIAREILEETGHRAATITPLATYNPLTGISDQTYHLFQATDTTRRAAPDPTEAARAEWHPFGDIPSLIAKGHVTDGPSLTGLTTFLVLSR